MYDLTEDMVIGSTCGHLCCADCTHRGRLGPFSASVFRVDHWGDSGPLVFCLCVCVCVCVCTRQHHIAKEGQYGSVGLLAY